MNAEDLAPFVAISVAVLGGLGWIIRAQIAMSRQFTPNGGSSLRDAINRLEIQVITLEKKMDDHVQFHLGQK